jgi:hypothetical protein
LRARRRRSAEQRERKGSENNGLDAGMGDQGRFRRQALSMISFEKYSS